jgi:hypothetical protein
MYDQIQEDAIFVMLYAVVTVLAALGGCVPGGHRLGPRVVLAGQSGYRSYRTFSVAFRQRTGQSVTAWMNEEGSA